MKEIGGYFGLEQFSGKPYHSGLAAVNSGRNALLYILKARGYRKLYIPRFLCDTVSQLCKREGIAYEEYGITPEFLPAFHGTPGPEEAVYIVNFYGQLPDTLLLQLQAQWGRIIVDNVQDFFRKPLAGVDTVYSCRKFFGVPDGGYAACEGAALSLEPDASRDRMTHILGRFEVSGSAYYSDFQANDEGFYPLPLREMSPLTQNLLRAVDYDAIRKARSTNYALLEKALGKENRLHLTAPDGPYCYPFYCQNGMAVKRALAQNKIYVPTLWPNVPENPAATPLEVDYAKNILPLPCDQRYTEDDMKRIVEEIQLCMNI